MKKKLLCKSMITLGLLLFFTLLLPFSQSANIAQAASLEKETKVEKVDYRLNLKSITLAKGKSFPLKVYNSENAKVSFKSDDAEIASVNEDGTITANKVGVTIITATVKDGTNPAVNFPCEVTVRPPAFSVKFTKSRIILGKDNVDTLRVILKPSNSAEDARFSSYDTSIVSVTTGGRITANKLGLTYVFAEIDATNQDGTRKFAVCTVIVTNPEDVSSLETYFAEHPELDMLSETNLSKALETFFNGKSQDKTPVTSGGNGNSKDSLVDQLHSYLGSEFDLKAAKEAYASMTSLNKLGVIFAKKSR